MSGPNTWKDSDILAQLPLATPTASTAPTPASGTVTSTGCRGDCNNSRNGTSVVPKMSKSKGAFAKKGSATTVRVPNAMTTTSSMHKSGRAKRKSENVYLRNGSTISASLPAPAALSLACGEESSPTAASRPAAPRRVGRRSAGLPRACTNGSVRARTPKTGSLPVNVPTIPLATETLCATPATVNVRCGEHVATSAHKATAPGTPSTTQILWPQRSCVAVQAEPTAEPTASGTQTPPISAARAAAPMADS
mmetsp:Transcript_56270/g.163125  ORF Transcript_56270/g.163125 Transcript_56270/m.163125 type:complete len:251 (+) Transcript_56270:357-1109(+)